MKKRMMGDEEEMRQWITSFFLISLSMLGGVLVLIFWQGSRIGPYPPLNITGATTSLPGQGESSISDINGTHILNPSATPSTNVSDADIRSTPTGIPEVVAPGIDTPA